MKRVLMTADTVGGVWTYALELAEALVMSGIEVVLATFGGHPTDAERSKAGRIRGLRLSTSDFKLEWMSDPWDDVAASGQWLLDLEAQYCPDIVHLNSFGHGALNWRNPTVLTAHSCVASWWRAVKGRSLPPEWDRYVSEVTRAVRSVDILVAPSRAMLRAIEFHYGPGLPPTRVAPNGCDPHRFCSSFKEPLILTAGRLWDEAKNAASVACIADRLPWPVFLAGDDCSPDGMQASFDGCRMLGRLASEAMAEWYSRASIYALPARYEPFGLSALEAALSGCALVLGDIPSLREVWEDAAVYVSPDDPDALQAAICELIVDEARRYAMARLAGARARAFTPERMASAYLDAYSAAIDIRRLACAS
jgi:glycogen synthase